MRRVAVFSTYFLPYSQTFIYNELVAHRRYHADVFAWRHMLKKRFPYKPVHVAHPSYIATARCRRFDRLFRERQFALVHAHFGTGGCYALPFAERHDLPLVVTFHGYDVAVFRDWWRFSPVFWPYAVRSKALLRYMALGLCASDELRELLFELGVPREKLVVHRLGLELSRFSPSQHDRKTARVLMVGRFIEKKGFAYGIRAFAKARQDGADVRLDIVGSGKLESKLRQLADDLKLGQSLRWLGSLSSSQVAKQLSTSDILLAPSVVASNGDRDSGLMVAKEACASHVVPIGSRHGGIPEIIDDGKTGYLVPERDVSGMAAHIVRLAGSAELRRELGRAGREKMEREYDNRQRVQVLEERYDEVVDAWRDRHREGAAAAPQGLRVGA